MENNKVKIIFLGSGEFGDKVCQGLIKGGYKPTVVTDFNKIEGLKPDLVIVASYGKIIPQKILAIPKHGSINVHPSLLPRYRGPSPIQTAILKGDKITGVTIMLMDEKIDHGKIIDQKEYKIPEGVNYKELEAMLAQQGVKLLLKIIPQWIGRKIKAKEQKHSQATYTKIIKREDGEIDWHKPIETERKIRAFDPWPGTFIFWKGKRIKILKVVIARNNKLIIKELQPEGKKPMSMADFLLGHPDFKK